MLRIDRVAAQMDVLPAASASGPSPAPIDASKLLADAQVRDRLKELVREALSEQLRELERRGDV